MKEYKEVDGTFYDARTSDIIINVLENCRINRTRITLDYGDTKTGKSWDECYDITGRIGRTTGSIKIPILVHNRRSTGGSAIHDNCIIGIRESRGGAVLYDHKLN
jgi:hypothetical protein